MECSKFDIELNSTSRCIFISFGTSMDVTYLYDWYLRTIIFKSWPHTLWTNRYEQINSDSTFQQLVLYEYIEAGLFCLTSALIRHGTTFDN